MTTRKEALKQLSRKVSESRSAVRKGLAVLEEDLREATGGLNVYATGEKVGLGLIGEDDWKYGHLNFDGESLNILTSSTHDDMFNSNTFCEGQMRVRHFSKISFEEDLMKLASPESISSLWDALELQIRKLLGEANSASSVISEFTGIQSVSIHDGLSNLITDEYFGKQWGKARQSIEIDPSDSLTRSSSFLESVCRHYLEKRQIDLPSSKVISELIGKVVKDFKPREGQEEPGVTDSLNKLYGGIKSIAQGTGSLRTQLGTAHGGHKVANSSDARLVNNLAGSIAIYILESLRIHLESTEPARPE